MLMFIPSTKPASFSPRTKAGILVSGNISKTKTTQNTDHPLRLLRACRRHPRCRAAQKGDELAPSHGPCLTPRTTPYHIVEKKRSYKTVPLVSG